MVREFRLTMATLLAMATFQATASAGLIYDSTSTSSSNQGITTTSSPQLGNEVTGAAGTSRLVTELDIAFTSQNIPATASLQAFLYANDGINGTPGTLLWQSAVMNNVSIDSYNALIAFSVPSVLVPNTFTFAASITNDPTIVGFVPSSSASTGTFNQAYAGSPGNWQPLPSAFEVGARVITSAVPEPSTFVLMGLGLGLTGLAAARRRRAVTA